MPRRRPTGRRRYGVKQAGRNIGGEGSCAGGRGRRRRRLRAPEDGSDCAATGDPGPGCEVSGRGRGGGRRGHGYARRGSWLCPHKHTARTRTHTMAWALVGGSNEALAPADEGRDAGGRAPAGVRHWARSLCCRPRSPSRRRPSPAETEVVAVARKRSRHRRTRPRRRRTPLPARRPWRWWTRRWRCQTRLHRRGTCP